MKITGPGSGAPPEPPGAPEESQGPAAKRFSEALEKAASTAAAQTGDVPAAKSLVEDIGADLRAGRITPEAAVERVIDRVIERHVGLDAPAAVREQVGAALRQALEDDPFLVGKIRALGAG